jgi:glycosyltransferase involved in cell wall biosynthesis
VEAAPSILYEVQNLALQAGTGIATYARNLASASIRLGYAPSALISVRRSLGGRNSQLNEILAFDSVPDREVESWWRAAVRIGSYPFKAVGGIKPVMLPRSGIVVGPQSEPFEQFAELLAFTRLTDLATAHFRLYGRFANLAPTFRPDLFHATHPVPVRVPRIPNVYTIHDLVPLRLPYTTQDNKKYFYRLLHRIAATADHIVTVSEYSRRDIIQVLGVDEGRVTNTYQPVDVPEEVITCPIDKVAETIMASFGVEPGGYYLFYGAIEPKKNLSRLLDAYGASGSKRPLLIAGSDGWQNSEDLRKIAEDRFQGFRIEGNLLRRHRMVRRLRYLPRAQLLLLIRGARAVLFPSIYEGFGLPVIEAMLLGTPVLTSNVASLPEVAGDASVLVDPYSVDDMTLGIRRLDNDEDLIRELVQRGRTQARRFSTSAFDDKLAKAYSRVL